VSGHDTRYMNQLFQARSESVREARAPASKRNARMLAWKPDLVIASPVVRGAADLVKQATAAGVEVRHVPESAAARQRR
jgi:hypothetical protein